MCRAEEVERKVMEMIIAADSQRLRPCEVTSRISQELAIPISKVKEALDELIRKRRLLCKYKDPCTYVEFPLKNWPREARPVKVVVNGNGNPWICHSDVDPSKDLAEQGGWRMSRKD